MTNQGDSMNASAAEQAIDPSHITEEECTHLAKDATSAPPSRWKLALNTLIEQRGNLASLNTHLARQCEELAAQVAELQGTEHVQAEWSSAPGFTLAELVIENGVSTTWLARALDLDMLSLHSFFNGEYELDSQLAGLLERYVGSTARFWLAREEAYRASMRRLVEDGESHEAQEAR